MEKSQTHRDPKPQRRTQVVRRDGSQRRLREAAIASLAECGCAGASTTEIARRAGLRQGGLFGHYASKAELSPGSGFSRPSVPTTVIWAIQGAAMEAVVTPETDDVEEFLTTLTEFAQSTRT